MPWDIPAEHQAQREGAHVCLACGKQGMAKHTPSAESGMQIHKQMSPSGGQDFIWKCCHLFLIRLCNGKVYEKVLQTLNTSTILANYCFSSAGLVPVDLQ